MRVHRGLMSAREVTEAKLEHQIESHSRAAERYRELAAEADGWAQEARDRLNRLRGLGDGKQ